MSRTKKFILTAMLVAIPLGASACRIPTGQAGCDLLVMEPGTQFGVVCNPF
jgi:hypothetical protein